MDSKPVHGTFPITLFSILVFNLIPALAYAGEWEITPSVEIKETYTDNVTLAISGNEQEDYVTQINPSIKITGKGKRLELDLSYTMQNIAYAESSDSDEIRNHLSAKAKATLIEGFLFMNASAIMNQQNTSLLGSSAQDNLSIVSDRADVQTISVSPYVKHNFANWFEGTAKYKFSTTEYDQSISDSESKNVNLALKNGSKFKKLRWNASYSNQQQDRDNQSDIEKENIKGVFYYALSNKFDAIVQGGDENNNLGTGITRANGGYWSAGFNYHPSYHLSLKMTGGHNEQTVGLIVAPTKRTSLQVTVRDADVGLVIGEQWSSLFSHRTKRSSWRLSYLEDTTTSQTEKLDAENFTYTGTIGGEKYYSHEDFYWDHTREEYEEIWGYYPLLNEVYQREVLSASVNYKTGKSDITLSLSNQERFMEVTNGTDTVLTTGLNWGWKHSDRLASSITGSWSQVEVDYSSPVSEYEIWSAGWNVTRTLSQNASATLGYRRAGREVSSGPIGEYEENRLKLFLQVKF